MDWHIGVILSSYKARYALLDTYTQEKQGDDEIADWDADRETFGH